MSICTGKLVTIAYTCIKIDVMKCTFVWSYVTAQCIGLTSYKFKSYLYFMIYTTNRRQFFNDF